MNLLRGWGGMKVTSWRKLPILLLGYDIRRWEKPGGEETYFVEEEKKLSFLDGWAGWGPTHLQYHSPWGFLFVWPLCFHAWYQIKPQQTKISDGGVVVPVAGSETVLYFRIGFARWDAHDSCYMVPTMYGGTHWD